MIKDENGQQFDFTVDKDNLYREESITDIKVASVRVMTPVKPDGSIDKSRTTIYFGHTQLMSPQGPIPLQAKLNANNLQEALDEFPNAMEKALAEVIEQFNQMQKEQTSQGQEDSRIIMPGS